MRARLLASLLAAAASSACIEDRLNVELTTQVFPDGTCTRRVVYRLVRNSDAPDEAARILPEDDPLRLFHRFPTGEPWTLREDVGADRHSVEVEASLPSPAAIEGDYWRSSVKRGVPARNVISFARVEGDPEVEFAYVESFRDPASPLEAMRALSRAMARHEDAFALLLLKDLGPGPLQKSEVKRAYRDSVTGPFAREVARLADRPVWGPRERADLDALWDRLDELQRDLVANLVLVAPSVPAETLSAALDRVGDELGESLAGEVERAGLSIGDARTGAARIHFRATLVLPGTIVRANTCTQGDTAVWEFDQGDLYGRGFEMSAESVSR
jgi:hypothetical protein